jgi:hypothetical protein
MSDSFKTRAAPMGKITDPMRKIINSTYISLDGVIENLHEWQPSVGPRGDKGDEIQTELLLSCDALIMGRRTYEVFAAVWPSRSGDPAGDHINSMSKYVVSSTLTDPEWTNTSVISGDPVEEIGRRSGCTRCSSGRPSLMTSSIAMGPARSSTSSTRRAFRTGS